MGQGKLGANLVSNVAFFALNIVVSLWLVSYLVRHLGVAAYGLVPLAVTVAGYFNVITAGLNAAVGRHLTVAMSKGDHARASSIFNSSLWAGALVAVLMCLLGLPLLGHISSVIEVPAGFEADAGWLFFLTVGGLAVTTFGSSYQSIVYSRNRFDLQNLGNILGLVGRVAVVVALFQISAPQLWHVGASVFFAAILTLGVVVWASRRLAPQLKARPADFSWPVVKEVSSTGVWIFVAQIGTLLLVNIDLLVANRIIGVADAGRYALVLQWSLLLRNFALVIGGVFGPPMLILFAEGKVDELIRYARRSVRFMGLMMALPVGLVCGFSESILRIWLGQDFVPLALVMVLATGHLGLNLAYLPLNHVSMATNNVKWPGIVQIIAGLVNLVAAIVLAHWFGLMGIAVAGGAVLLLRNTLFTPIYAAKVLHRPAMTFVRGALPLFLVSVGVGLASWAVSHFLAPRHWGSLVASGLLVSAAYAVIAWFLLLSAAERAGIVEKVRRKLKR